MLSLLLTFLCSNGQWARKLPDVVEVEVNKETAVIQGQVTMHFTITKPDLLSRKIPTMAETRGHQGNGKCYVVPV